MAAKTALGPMATPGRSRTGSSFGSKTTTAHPGGGTWSSYRNSRGKRIWWIGFIPLAMEALRWM